jgi:hypothetical protein
MFQGRGMPKFRSKRHYATQNVSLWCLKRDAGQTMNHIHFSQVKKWPFMDGH